MQPLGKLFQRHAEGIFIALLLLFSAVMFYYSFSIIGMSKAADKAGPALMPKLIFGLMTALSILLLIEYISRARACRYVAGDAEARKRGVISITGILGFVFLMDKLGFLLSSVLYLFFAMYMLGPKEKRKPVLWAVIAVLFGVAVYYLFRYQVYVKLPKGILG